ncbi:ectonucleoside triphosphate diphosphohydrolase 4-like isoform X1 [Apostichopus japonicus]|uniref:ectonucleoside triphosphate diphosphohydrolase 4-like isoform X1 n=1 Tax=Stichopus japonicus TaxID=307972 RepID=UPI003AB4DF77
MARSFRMTFPTVWQISVRKPSRQRRIAVLLIVVSLFLIFTYLAHETLSQHHEKDAVFREYARKYEHIEVTNTDDDNLYYGIVIDMGSSGSRVFVYFWPQHTGKSNELLHIQQMRDQERNPVVKKIKPGISSLADFPEKVDGYVKNLLDYAAKHIPASKHHETPLYILATAGMRMLPQSKQDNLLSRLREGVPQHYNFLFSDSSVEIISGKQEGVYAWIGINYVLGRFNHDESDPYKVAIDIPGDGRLVRKRTVGVLDMGGGSAQIAFEVPQKIEFTNKELLAKGHIAEFNLGCHQHESDHVYRVYVTTFLGYGGNAARHRYEKLLFNGTRGTEDSDSPLDRRGTSSANPLLDPCLPKSLEDTISFDKKDIFLKGSGDYDKCQDRLKPLLNLTVPCEKEPCSFNGIFQPSVRFNNSEFYGFSEYWYCMEDVLRIGGVYEYDQFRKAAKNYCATRWSLLKEHYEKGLYSKADEFRIKFQCFKSAWITTVLHEGFKFPRGYKYLRTASLIHDKEVQWTLGAILHRTRFLPLREIQQSSLQQNKPPWVKSPNPWLSNQYLLLLCFIIVGIFIFVYIRWLRSMSPQRGTLARVPTMAYFMTEEGQVQDGVYETKGLLPS